MSYEEPVLLEVDSRRRLSLGELAKHKYYLVSADEDGTIRLVPAAVVPLATYNDLAYQALAASHQAGRDSAVPG